MLVSIFDEESKVNEASRYLDELQVGQDVIGQAVLRKNVDGHVLLQKSTNAYPEGEVRETAINALIDLLTNDRAMSSVQKEVAMSLAGIDIEFLRHVSEEFKPGSFALISNVHKDDMSTVDDRISTLGGHVFRME